ncbi:MAG: hypothetical protein ACO34J_08120, partial [Prochlorothrix sp.]
LALAFRWTSYRTAQHSTAQHSTVQHSTAQYSTAQYSTAEIPTSVRWTSYSTAQHSTAEIPTPVLVRASGCIPLWKNLGRGRACPERCRRVPTLFGPDQSFWAAATTGGLPLPDWLNRSELIYEVNLKRAESTVVKGL